MQGERSYERHRSSTAQFSVCSNSECPQKNRTLKSASIFACLDDGDLYKVAGVKYNIGKHLMCFCELGDSESWQYYDGLLEYKKVGCEDTPATEEEFSEALRKESVSSHVVAV
ncbi:hypothetical protein Y1Q_0019969 [Alligator mississippiensis]|uniref:Uncharacterized protein n=1 Tax=Alligator mississippiensis TaxID=8496 RepID=A0A151PDV0_ALLMI|nr:hypothetical protein Y1Q_0019969 [Alligator mississippiensis]